MDIKITEKPDHTEPKIGDIKRGTLIRYQNHTYIKVDKRVGSGLSIDWTANNCILLNLKWGTLREIPGGVHVTILHQREPLLVHKALDLKTIGLYTK